MDIWLRILVVVVFAGGLLGWYKGAELIAPEKGRWYVFWKSLSVIMIISAFIVATIWW